MLVFFYLFFFEIIFIFARSKTLLSLVLFKVKQFCVLRELRLQLAGSVFSAPGASVWDSGGSTLQTTATDPDGDAIVYSLGTGAGSNFVIDSTTGIISAIGVFDYEVSFLLNEKKSRQVCLLWYVRMRACVRALTSNYFCYNSCILPVAAQGGAVYQ